MNKALQENPGMIGDHASSASIPRMDNGSGAPFIFVAHQDGETRVSGSSNGFAGHRMWLADDQQPHGLFANWCWDGRCLTAEVDPLGYFSLFVYVGDGQIGISPSIFQLLANGADPHPDAVALAVFHRIGFFLENDTPFTAIRTLAPGTRLHWEAGTLQIQGGKPATPAVAEFSREQAIEAFIELPRASIRRFLDHWDGPICMPLSGGRDSRHILLEMLQQGRVPDTCVTFHHGGENFNNEVQTARAITHRGRLHHTLLGQPRRRLRDSVRALLMTQLCADEHAQMMPIHDFLHGSRHASIDGIGGDILTTPDDLAAGFMAKSRYGDYSSIARQLADGHAAVISRPGHQGGAGSIYSPELEEAAIERITAALRAHDGAPDPYQSFWFWNRTRREISFVSAGIMGSAETVFCPYLDPAMVELGLSLPWSLTCHQDLHDEAIRRAFPAYADIPFAGAFRDQQPALQPLRRATALLDACRVLAMLMPDRQTRAMRDLLIKDGLQRPHTDIYRLHNAMVTDMDAAQAERLIEVSKALNAAAPKGELVVSEVFPHG